MGSSKIEKHRAVLKEEMKKLKAREAVAKMAAATAKELGKIKSAAADLKKEMKSEAD